MENSKPQKLSPASAIIIAGVLIMVGILVTRGGSGGVVKEKTLSEQVGVSKAKFDECVQNFDQTAFGQKIQDSVTNAMKGEEGIGTPFSVVVGADGVKSKINGADSYENVMAVIDEVRSGKVTVPYTGDLPPLIEGEHVMGNPNTADVTIVEYSDFECPFCARFHPVLEQVVAESNGSVAWVYRQFPLTQIHEHAFERAIASECVAQIKGNDAFWEYANLLFGLITPKEAPISEQL